SRSMLIADRDGQPRSQFVQRELSGPQAPLLNELSKRFVLRFFKFSSSAGRVASPAEARYDGTSTRLGDALERARDELSGLPLAGLVMVTDGADTSDTSIDDALASLKARSIPVFPVGLGQERFSHDIQISRVETPRVVLKGSSLVVDVVVSQTGFAGKTVPLNVEDGGRIVATEQVTLPPDGESLTARVRFTANEAGARMFRFRIPTQDGEEVTQNNTRDALLEVRDRVEKILYYEGEPRAEGKFIIDNVDDDKNLNVVWLLRTAENKYYRRNVSTPDEVVGGFPKTREELFAYRALVLGSVEAASFTPDQLRMIADFVNKRGGGLLMLGGRRAFAEGGWAGTPVGEVLPVVLDNDNGRKSASYFSMLSVHPSRAGETSPVTQIAENEARSLERWNEMPEVSAVNPIRAVKPGATTLLQATDRQKQDQIVLAYQRYGRGKSVALPIQDSWLWKMDAKIPVEDTTYAVFWRRLLRWVVDGVPDPVNVTTSQDRVEPGEAVKITADIYDPAYVEVNDSQVIAAVTSPSGKRTEIPMEWTISRDGEYKASFVPDEQGVYDIKVEAARTTGGQSKTLGNGEVHVRVSAGDAEYFDAAMRGSLLRRIADDTGGHFFTAANAAALPEAVTYTGRGVTVVEERDLWDMPIVLLALLGLLAAEWGFRRVRGLA
ncbi:MAG TPA: glutamine amidotransferase, partial [Vicinamibacterales bacterium]|nr:glutamine amidotransferase [Vicinamibacterales bacterium]